MSDYEKQMKEINRQFTWFWIISSIVVFAMIGFLVSVHEDRDVECMRSGGKEYVSAEGNLIGKVMVYDRICVMPK